jgi:hypothetical protein
MLKLTTLSDTQSELMQGGRRSSNGNGSPRPRRGSNGPIRQTTNNIYVGASQDSFAGAFTLGGENSLAYNSVGQIMNIGVSV